MQKLHELQVLVGEERFRELSSMLLTDCKTQLQRILDGLGRNDEAMVLKAAHWLKGVLSQFGSSTGAALASSICADPKGTWPGGIVALVVETERFLADLEIFDRGCLPTPKSDAHD
jgi:hypothetical protein